jgi:hypothetical protein
MNAPTDLAALKTAKRRLGERVYAVIGTTL